MTRLYNFSAGPAMLPLEVVEIVQNNLADYNNTGLGLMEMSHRSSAFEEIITSAEANLRKLLDIPDSYAVLFMTGGATTQFSMVPMNLGIQGTAANYMLSGIWSEKALQEAAKFTEVNIAGSSKEDNFSRIPTTITLSSNASYLHFTSNNTIVGTQYKTEPDAGKVPLICDASSDFLHKKIDISKYGLIYAGAQKNLGPAGVTLVIIRKDLLARSAKTLPILMNYNTYAESKSLYNTPPCLPIYVVGEVLKWIEREGGLKAIEERNIRKAAIIYNYLDQSGFYYGTSEKDSRSLMNLTFRIKNQDLEPQFVKQAAAAGFTDLKGHRFVGGLRASIYNAFPEQGCKDLITFMETFAKENG